MEIIDNKALMLKTRNPDKVTQVITQSYVTSETQTPTGIGYEIAVKWTLPNAKILQNLGFKNVPSPIMGQYKWPGMYKPFEHQKVTASFLTLNQRAFCLNDMGTGKTMSVIWAADYLMTKKIIKRVLVICPLSIMDPAWRADLFKTAMHRRVDIAHGAKDKRIKVINSNAEFVIINYDGIEIVANEIAKGGFDLIVCDECFVAGTEIATPNGLTPIELLNEGDEVLTSSGVQRIKSLICKTSDNIVTLELSNGRQITCTANHPFLTDIGWVTAENTNGRRLVSETTLSLMRKTLPLLKESIPVAKGAEHPMWVDLLSILRTEEIQHIKSGEVLLFNNATRTEGEIYGDEEVGRVSEKNVREPQKNGALPINTWGEWGWDDINGGVNTGDIIRKMGVELCGHVGQEAARLSHMLQIRLCKSQLKNWVGSGWELPRYENEERTGLEKSLETEGTWVVSVTHKKQRSGETVYNLEVAGTPNYFAEGYLVHNCSALKTPTTNRWKTLNRLINQHTWLWLLTGTPAAQSPMDAYGLAKMLRPDSVPRYIGAFRDQVMVKLTQFKYVPRPEAQKIVHKVLQPAIRYTKEECLDLPELVYTERDTPITPQQRKYYDLLKKEMLFEAAGEEVSAVNAAVKMNKLLQISSGAAYTDTGEVIEFDCSVRLKEMVEIVQQSSHKTLIFANFKHGIVTIKRHLDSLGITSEIIHGGVSANNRTKIFNKFQMEKDPQVLIIQPKAAAHGVTLHAANTIIWWGPITSTETYLQANARVHRQGQKNPCTVVHLVGSAVERSLYTSLSNKTEAQNTLLNMYKNIFGLI